MRPVVISVLGIILLLTLVKCSKESMPQSMDYQLIDRLVTDKDSIWPGPDDAATIRCYAIGENLSYLWHAELGDIQVQDAEGSVIKYTAAECCSGYRHITCTVSDDMGSDVDTIPIFVLY